MLNATIAGRKDFPEMSRGEDESRSEIVMAARAFSRLGYVHAFGHVSRRMGDSLLITPTRPPLAAQRAEDIIEVDFNARVLRGDAAARPIEVFLHIGIYKSRADVHAICRTHARHASVWPTGGQAPLIQHGFGGIAGTVAHYEGCDLIHTAELGASAAQSLGSADALLLRGNGVLTVGATLAEAAARTWSLEERCAQARLQAMHPAPFSAEDLAARSRWYPAESERIWTWLKFLGSSDSSIESGTF
jgi:HCOMODA/2-hydroxy-3-carboxy-muconic semialdehyde decarboxylase